MDPREMGSPRDALFGTSRQHWRWSADGAVIVTIIVLWWIWLYPGVTERWPVARDTFRDTASVENGLAGRWLCDPTIKGETYWYAPLGPMVFTVICTLTRQDPLVVYASSILWLNVFLPIGWYALARLCWGRRTIAVAAVLIVWLGSRWWTTHIAMPMTSIQGVILSAATLICWLVTLRRKRRWAAGVGVLLALCTWCHILSGMLAAGAIGFHAIVAADTPADGGAGRRSAMRWRMLITGGVCGLLVAPLAWHMLKLPRVNVEPIEYLARELRDPAFSLYAHALLVLPLMAIGTIDVCRKLRHPAGLIVGYALVALIGQGLGYVRLVTGFDVPIVTPHEFQWHFQIAAGLLAAGGTARLAAWTAERIASGRKATLSRDPKGSARWTLPQQSLFLVLVALAIAGGAIGALHRQSLYWRSDRPAPGMTQAVDWIKRNTTIDDVFLGVFPTNYYVIAGRTGRKLVCPPEGHANIAVSLKQRSGDHRRMFETTDLAVFRRLQEKYGVAYVFLVDEKMPAVARWQARGVLEPVFRNDAENITILRVMPAPAK